MMNQMYTKYVNKNREGYFPYQPDFEQKQSYQNFGVTKDHALWGIVSDFYQFYVDKDSTESICIIPDGCIDILFRYHDNHFYSTLEGFHLEKMILPIPESGLAFGIRFLPGGISSVLDVDVSSLVGRQIGLYDLFSYDDRLAKMEETFDFMDRVFLVSSFLVDQLITKHSSIQVVRNCAHKIIQSHGNLSLSVLADDTGYTLRHLRELFHRHVGISPKGLCEIVQFQQSFFQYSYLIEKYGDCNLSDLAMESGYYDQSHMNKNYRKMAGTLPLKLYLEIDKEQNKQPVSLRREL